MVDSFTVYLGPSIRGVVQRGTIYPGNRAEVERSLEREIKKYPRIRNLLVGDNTFVTDRIQVKTPGTRLFTEYMKLCAEVKQGG